MGRQRRRRLRPKVDWDWANALVKSARMSASKCDEGWDKALTPEAVRRLWAHQVGRCHFNNDIVLEIPLKVDPRQGIREAVIAAGNSNRLNDIPMLVRIVNTGAWRAGGVCLIAAGMKGMLELANWDIVELKKMCQTIASSDNSLVATRDQLIRPQLQKELELKCDHTPTSLSTEAAQQQPR